MNDDEVYVYDKAKYHFESIDEYGLPDEHAYNHTTFFLAWILKNGLTSDWMREESGDDIGAVLAGTMTVNEFYESWDCYLISDMLNDEGNAFARHYFDFGKGNYLADYAEHLQKELPTELHVAYTPENEATIHRVIDRRFAEWKNAAS